MSILKEIAEGTALLEVSKQMIGRYLAKSADKIVDHAYDMGAAAQHGGEHDTYVASQKKASKRLRGVKLATDKLQKEEVELKEGNAENKLKKNIHVAKVGMKAHPAIRDKEGAELHVALKRDNQGTSQKFAQKSVVDTLKREGRREIKNPTKHDGEYHAHYDSKAGVYHVKHRETGKIVDHNVANSGGAALAAADRWNKKSVKEETTIEEGHRKGRPKKARHEDGKIVNDPEANDTKPAN
jgi:hypothetical protein